MAADRQRYSSTASDLAAVLAPFATSITVCSYADESPLVGKAKLIKGKKGSNGENFKLLGALRDPAQLGVPEVRPAAGDDEGH